ncbi:MAG: hypothetical protein IPK39_20715 [Sulfuritalea sp.]|nr:hypothetical protein [Sulfuritalea sp.]
MRLTPMKAASAFIKKRDTETLLSLVLAKSLNHHDQFHFARWKCPPGFSLLKATPAGDIEKNLQAAFPPACSPSWICDREELMFSAKSFPTRENSWRSQARVTELEARNQKPRPPRTPERHRFPLPPQLKVVLRPPLPQTTFPQGQREHGELLARLSR